MAQRSSLRASDEDRERIADRLRKAAAEGRLHAHELEERVASAMRARTYGELDPLVADLPSEATRTQRAVGRQTPHGAAHWAKPAVAVAIVAPVAIVAAAIVVAAVVFLVTGVFAVWLVWVALGWWFFGHRHHQHGPGHRRGRQFQRPFS